MDKIVSVFSLGSIYALVTLGYALITTVMRFLNFAHADVLAVGAYITVLTQNPVLAVLGCGVCATLSNAVYQNSKKLITASVGVSLVIQYSLMLIFSATPKVYPHFFKPVNFFGAAVTPQSVWGFAVSIVLAALLWAVLKFTRIGLFLRATADNPNSAAIVGINSKAVFFYCFLISGILAGVGGVFYSLSYPVTALMGASLSIKAFVCATLGGRASLLGAFLSGFLLSALESAVCTFIGSGWRDIVTFVILIAVLSLDKEK